MVFGKIGPLPIKQSIPMRIRGMLTKTARKNRPSVAAEAGRSVAGVF